MSRPDIVVVNEQEKKCTIIDIAVPADKRIGENENEKVEKQDLKVINSLEIVLLSNFFETWPD